MVNIEAEREFLVEKSQKGHARNLEDGVVYKLFVAAGFSLRQNPTPNSFRRTR
jgi:hypothetical protein